MTSLVSHKPGFAAATRGSGPATSLRVVRELFAAFHAAGIPYCHWKSNEHLGRSMVGLTDLDVLIARERAGVIEQILACNGLKRFTATPLRSYPGIEDYLTLDDDDTGRLVHLHLHYQLTLGEPFLKGYRLPWEPLLLSTRRMDAEHGIYVADANLEFLLLAVRGALKLRLRNMFRMRLGSAFLAELYWLRERVEPQQVLALGEELLGGRVAGPLRALLINEPSLRLLVSLRRAAAPSLRHHRTYRPLQAHARACLCEGASVLTALSRTFLGMALPARRTSPRGGLIVAILGCDGSGKSSVVKEVVGSLGRKVDILPIYFGSGDGRSSVVRLPLKLAHKLMRGTVRSRPTSPRVEGQRLERTPSSHPGNRRWRTLATVIWALALSHEKRGKLRRAVRARNRGMIVVCDRLPQNQVMGFNDGPLLARWSNHRAWLPRCLARWEATVYERCSTHPPDIVVKLTVSPEVAMARKPDTPEWEVRRRVEAVRQLRFPSTVQVVEIDAEAPFATVCLAVKRMIWRAA